MGIRIQALFNPAGGLRYHGRALFHKSLWRPFHQELQQWMQTFRPQTRGLILCAASGGYALSTDYLAQYESIVVNDIDPLAFTIFKRRHKHPGLTCDSNDYLLAGRPDHGIAQLRRKYPGHAILLCNFLGQLRFLWPDPEDEKNIRKHLQVLTNELKKESFLSFHDLLSGSQAPKIKPIFAYQLENIRQSFYKEESEIVTELLDHFSSQYFDELPHHYFCWQLRPGQYQLIEGVFQI